VFTNDNQFYRGLFQFFSRKKPKRSSGVKDKGLSIELERALNDLTYIANHLKVDDELSEVNVFLRCSNFYLNAKHICEYAAYI